MVAEVEVGVRVWSLQSANDLDFNVSARPVLTSYVVRNVALNRKRLDADFK